MALAPNALVSTEDATAFLLAGESDAPLIELSVNRASQLIEAYCGRPLRTRTLSALRLQGPEKCHLYVAAAPIDVSKTLTVSVDGVAQTVWKAESDGDPINFDVIVGRSVETGVFQPDHLFRACGWRPCTQPYNVLLSYEGGFALTTVPADLMDAALLTVRRIFDDVKKSVGEVVTVNTPAGGVTLFDRWLPSRAREVLDMGYRLVTVG